jgi:Alginate export
MMKKAPYKYAATIAALMVSTSASAADAQNFSELFKKGDVGVDLRYRLETVNQDGFLKDAAASTLLTKLWFRTASLNGFSAFVEATNVSSIGADTYNSTVNGNITRPVVADPETTELNQAYLQYKADWGKVLVGRQALNLDTQRFIGTVGWRQNDQTYDIASVTLTPTKDIKALYGYVWNVNRIFGGDHPLGDLKTNTQMFNVSYTGLDFGTLSAYGYFIDLNDAPVFGLSSATVGARFVGKRAVSESVKLGYEIEYANQTDYKDNPADYSADYLHLGVSAKAAGFTVGFDYELLGSDNGASFQTPFATLHKFNGWADKFLKTPTNGLKDVFATIAYKVSGDSFMKGTLLKAVYHDFTSDVGGLDYGSEWDFLVTKKLRKNVTGLIKAAFYRTDGFATDTDKIWVMVTAKF